MWSFQDQYTQFQDMSQDTSAGSLVIGKRNINMGQRILEAEIGTYYTEAFRTFSTVTTGITYESPENFIRLKSLYVTNASFQYTAEEIFDEEVWRIYRANTTITSDILQKVFVRAKTFEVYPKFSTAGLTMSMIYEALSKDLSQPDYTTGTIVSLANLGTALVGSGTAWTSALIGRFVQLSGNSDTEWYEISAVPSVTSITLKKPYQGIAISAATQTYRIGEMPRTPGTTHIIPVYFALWKHYEGVRRDVKMAVYYKSLYEQNMQWAKTTFARRYSTEYIPSSRGIRKMPLKNPNFYPTILS